MKPKTRIGLTLLSALVIGGGIYFYFRRDPLAGLESIHEDRVEQGLSSQYPDGTGKQTRTFYYSGENAHLALDILKRDLLGRGWKLRTSDENYACFTNSLRAPRSEAMMFQSGKDDFTSVSVSPGTDDVNWFLTDDGTPKAVVHEYRQLSMPHARALVFLHLMKAGPPQSSLSKFVSRRPGVDGDLLYALVHDDLAAAKDAIARGADVNGASSRQPLMPIALRRGDLAMAQLLLDHGADINASQTSGRNSIDFFCDGHVDALKFAFAHGGKFHGQGEIALCKCAMTESPVDQMLAEPWDGRAWKEPTTVTEWMISYAQASDHATDASHKQVWMSDGVEADERFWKNSAQIAEILLSHGAKVDGTCLILEAGGRTPLQLAASAGNAPLVKVLLDHGADPTLRDLTNRTARQIALDAKRNLWREVIAILDKALAERVAPAHHA